MNLIFKKVISNVLIICFAHIATAQKTVVSATKLNVLYIALDNRIDFATPNSRYKHFIIEVSEGTIKVDSDSSLSFVWRVTKAGKVSATISVMENGKKVELAKKEFRAKYIPDPIAKLGRDNGGDITAASFKAQTGIVALIECCGFEARCEVKEFTLTRVPQGQPTPIICKNKGGKYEPKTSALVNVASVGDAYYFTDVTAYCPSDPINRIINELNFKISKE